MVHPETSAYARGQRDDFVQLSIDLVRFRRLGIMQGDYEQGVTFNEDLARKKGFSEQEIALGKQIVEATNILIAQSKTAQAKGELASVDRFSLDLQRYPELRQFWNKAANVDVRSAQMNDLQSILEPLDVSGVSHWVCGYYFHPVPAQSAPWHTHHTVRTLPLLCALGAIIQPQTWQEVVGLALKRTSGGCVDGLRLGSKTTRAQCLASLTPKCGAQDLGLILIGLCMSCVGIKKDLDDN